MINLKIDIDAPGSPGILADVMSGGHWDYAGFKIDDAMCTVASDERAKERFPLTIAAFQALRQPLYDAEHEMDWDFEADGMIEDDKAFDRKAFTKILKAVLEVAPDDLLLQILHERADK